MLHVKFTSRPFDKLETQCAVVTAYSDVRPLKGHAALLDWRLNGRLSRLFMGARFKGEFQDVLLLPSEGRLKAKDVLVLGLGDHLAFGESRVPAFIQFLLDKLAKIRVSDFMVSFSDIISDRFEWRNSIRLLVSKLHDYTPIQSVRLCESEECVKDAKRRHMDFGLNVDVSFETLS